MCRFRAWAMHSVRLHVHRSIERHKIKAVMLQICEFVHFIRSTTNLGWTPNSRFRCFTKPPESSTASQQGFSSSGVDGSSSKKYRIASSLYLYFVPRNGLAHKRPPVHEKPVYRQVLVSPCTHSFDPSRLRHFCENSHIASWYS